MLRLRSINFNYSRPSIVGILLALIVTMVPVGSAKAVNGSLPDLTATNNPSMFLVIGRRGYGNTYNAPTTSVKLAFSANEPKATRVNIYDGSFCAASNYDSNSTAPGKVIPTPPYPVGTCTSPTANTTVLYRFTPISNSTGNPIGPSIVVSAGTMAVNGTSVVNLASLNSLPNDTDGRHFVQMDAFFSIQTSGLGGVNAFRVSIPDSSIGPAATRQSYSTYATDNNSALPLGIQSRAPSIKTTSSYSFEFAPDCNLPSPTTKILKWQDADAASFGQSSLHFDLMDVTNGSPGVLVKKVSGAALGGSGVTGTALVSFLPGHKYRWTWYGVNGLNAIQVWMPFDSYNFVRSCFTVVPNITNVFPTPIAPGPLTTGQIYTLTPQMHNNGPGTSKPVKMTVMLPSRVTFISANNSGTIGPGGVITWPPRTLLSGANWNANTFTFRVIGPVGLATFLETINPSDADNGTASASITYNVQTEAYPSYNGYGDIHAGGGYCGTAPVLGKVFSNIKSASLSSYVVSSSGSISETGSNGALSSTPAGKAASLGASGQYLTVCRPDLFAVAQAYTGFSFALGPIDVSGPGPDAIMIGPSGSGPIVISGTISRKLTIYNPYPSRPIVFNSDVALSAAGTAAKSQPSLAILTKGDVSILPSARNVDAYIFSDGNINTCDVPAPFAACNNLLTIHGFLMAKSLSLHRLGVQSPLNSTPLGENIILNPQIYINPPRFFDNAGGLNLTQSQGERPPLQ